MVDLTLVAIRSLATKARTKVSVLVLVGSVVKNRFEDMGTAQRYHTAGSGSHEEEMLIHSHAAKDIVDLYDYSQCHTDEAGIALL